MSRLLYEELLLANLARKFPKGTRQYLPPEQVLEELREKTGQDFGYDVEKWRAWLQAHGLE